MPVGTNCSALMIFCIFSEETTLHPTQPVFIELAYLCSFPLISIVFYCSIHFEQAMLVELESPSFNGPSEEEEIWS